MSPTGTISTPVPAKPSRKPGWYLWMLMIFSLTGAVMTWVPMVVGHRAVGTLNAAAILAAWVYDFLWTLRMLEADLKAGLIDDRQRFRDTVDACILVVSVIFAICGIVALGWTLPASPPTSIR